MFLHLEDFLFHIHLQRAFQVLHFRIGINNWMNEGYQSDYSTSEFLENPVSDLPK